ncbi:MAG: hypothetical protein RLZZ458_2240 [Planctomycetota bacterium]
MARSLRILTLLAAFAFASGLFPASATPAVACPGCKTANETESLRPRAYMLSILFMLGMPATVFTGFGVAFYRMSKRSAADTAALEEYLQQHASQHPQAPTDN